MSHDGGLATPPALKSRFVASSAHLRAASSNGAHWHGRADQIHAGDCLQQRQGIALGFERGKQPGVKAGDL